MGLERGKICLFSIKTWCLSFLGCKIRQKSLNLWNKIYKVWHEIEEKKGMNYKKYENLIKLF